MLKKASLALALVIAAGSTFAGGKGGTELAIASYGGLGAMASVGIPLDITFLSANGLRTYGEVEIGVGVQDNIAIGAELSGGILVGVAQGFSVYGSLGPAIGFSGSNSSFGLGAEIGLNIDVNRSSVFIEAGNHPASSYVAVGLRL